MVESRETADPGNGSRRINVGPMVSSEEETKGGVEN